MVNGQEPDFFFFSFEDLQMSLRISGSFDWTNWFPQEKKFFDFIQHGQAFLTFVFSVMGFLGGSVGKESAMQETRVDFLCGKDPISPPLSESCLKYTSCLL